MPLLTQTDKYNTEKQSLEKKIGGVENKVPDINDLATTAVLNTKIGEVENKDFDVSKLVKKADYDSKMTGIKEIYFTTSD